MHTYYYQGVTFAVLYDNKRPCPDCVRTGVRLVRAYQIVHQRFRDDEAQPVIVQGLRVLGAREFDYAEHLRETHGYSANMSSRAVMRIADAAAEV